MSQLLNQVLQVNMYLQPLQFLLSIIANTLNICLLCSCTLRSSPCTHYFMAYAIFSIIYTCLICPLQFLRGFNIYLVNTPIGCRLHLYFVFLPSLLARMMLVLASFDRYCASFQPQRLNSSSTVRKARLLIIIATILCITYMSPLLAIYHRKESSGTCLQDSNLLINIYIFSQILLYYISAPLLMIIFGLLTISNTRRLLTRIGPQLNFGRWRRTERQLTRMLLLQMSIHLVLTLPFGIIYSMNAFDPSTITSNIMTVRNILVIWQQCDYFVSFFLYIFSGSAYRKQLVHMLKSIKLRNRIIHPFKK
ncbi:unnamed protein product [Rotaria sp. Silwood2]|nr:unnamed protein product [Rotaria sp. Silwood2]CAF3061732.1 unnamed protein product [Rotaria sp. Silwood2]CAF3322781.1 unnamed protein product [Rotaria sp. Silwood2]CAF4286870.1 unnamed protein product [Rotaria sp. Silwood2]CAF4380881.1 unnamed protein product [Rotaria sp. Silwood2]